MCCVCLMLLFILNFQNEKKTGFSDTRTTERDNDPNGIMQHPIKKRKTITSFPLCSPFFPFQYLLSKPVLIWNKSLGSVKHQVVDWGGFSSNRWLKHFMTNGQGTIASQTIFRLPLYTTAATKLGSSKSRSPEPGPHLPTNATGRRLQEPRSLLPGRCSGQLHSRSWHQAPGENPELAISDKELGKHWF